MKIRVADEELKLLPEKAFFWEKERLLGLSDVHIGKAESYQHAGVPLPSGAHRQDLHRIADLIESTQAQQVAVLGDWLHNQHSVSHLVSQDLQSFFHHFRDIHWVLILGNHEIGSAEILERMPFHYVREDWQVGPFLMTHGHKYRKSDFFQIQGHTHPLVRLQQGPTKVTLPCFHLEPHCLTIPAFGSLTGGYVIRPGRRDRVFGVTPNEIFELP